MNKKSICTGLAAGALLAAAVSGCCGPRCGRLSSEGNVDNISVFAKFVSMTAKEKGVSIADAADLLYDIGVRGYDCGPDEDKLKELAATKLKAINLYYFPTGSTASRRTGIHTMPTRQRRTNAWPWRRNT